MSNLHDVVLLNPPYSTIGNPYISIPVLSSFLEQEGINVFSCDLDPLLYRELSKPENVQRGIEHAKQRFTKLNDLDKLSFSEAVEYKMSAILLFQLSWHGERLIEFLQNAYSFEEFKKTPFKKVLLSASSAMNFPEMIITSPQFAVNSEYDSNSVAEIMASLDADNSSVRMLYNLLDSLLESHDSPIWGISVPFQSQIIKAFQCAAYIKQKRPTSFVILGGPSISLYFRKLPDNRLFSIVDAFAYYEGELTLKSLVSVWNSKGSLHGVPGIGFLEQDRIVYTAPADELHIDQCATPDFSATDLNDYLNERERITASIRLSKGCAWGKCTFCSSYDSQYTQISKGKALDQLLRIYNETGIRNYMFSDEASPLEVLDHIAKELIASAIRITWIFHTRLTTMLTEERCDLYRKAGCRQICVGIESTSDRILRIMNKGISFKQIDTFFNQPDRGIPVVAYMMVGFPGETVEEAQDGFQYIQRLVREKKLSSFTYSQFVIKPGSAVWNDPELFSIAGIHRDNTIDLDHSIYNFSSDGMTFEEVYERYTSFSGKKRLETIYSKIKVIQFQELNEPLNFQLQDVTDLVDSDISFLYRPMREWMNKQVALPRSVEISW